MFRPARSHQILCLCACLMAPGLATSAATPAAEATVQEFAAVGEQLATIFNDRQTDTLASKFDISALAARVAVNVYDDESSRGGFARGYTKSTQSTSIAKVLMASLERSPDSEVKFMGVVARDGEHRPLLRFDLGDNGFDYVEFVVRPDAEGEWKIVDWGPLSLGELYSEAIGRLARIFASPAPGLVKSLLGMPQLDQATVARVRTINELRGKGDMRGALQEMARLPAVLADTRVVLTQLAQTASSAGDDDAYRKALVRLEQLHHDDPAAAFMLLDQYFYANDIDKVLRVIAVIERRVGVDGLTLLLRANIHMAVGRHTEAIVYARRAIDLEPERSTPYFTLAQSQVELGRFDEAIGSYLTLQNDFGYEFTKERFAQNAVFAKFIASPQFKEWLP